MLTKIKNKLTEPVTFTKGHSLVITLIVLCDALDMIKGYLVNAF